MEQFSDDPIALVVIVLVVGGFVAHRLWRWRQSVALRRQADEQGWQPVDDPGAFGELVVGVVPELRERAEQDARAASRSGRGAGAGPGLRVRVGPSPSGRSHVRSEDVHRIPVPAGEVVAGNIAVAAQVGKVTGGRTALDRGAVLARAPAELPDVRLISRSWIDRDGGGDLPDALTATFNDQTLDADARDAYLDSGAWQALPQVASEVDALVVADQNIVVVCSGPLTVERVQQVTAAISEFIDRAIATPPRGGGAGAARLSDPLPAS